MYAAFQADSLIFDFWRTDGYPFGGRVADVKYHKEKEKPFSPEL